MKQQALFSEPEAVHPCMTIRCGAIRGFPETGYKCCGSLTQDQAETLAQVVIDAGGWGTDWGVRGGRCWTLENKLQAISDEWRKPCVDDEPELNADEENLLGD